MKFIHIADVHLGAAPDRDFPWGAERATEIWNTFSEVIEIAKQEKTDLLLVAGDLFHGQPLVRELKEVAYCFSQIPDTTVVLAAGNHDYLRRDSNYLTFSWPDNVVGLWTDTCEGVYLEKLNTYVYGMSYQEREIMEPVYNQTFPGGRINLKTEHPDAVHILVAHGGDEKHIPIRHTALAGADFDYIALGHIHKPEILVPGKMAYAGSLEPIDKNETGEHGYIKGIIRENQDFVLGADSRSTEVTFVPASSREYKDMVLQVAAYSTRSSLLSRAKKYVKEHGEQHIYRITLNGFRDPDMDFSHMDFSSAGNVIEVRDETEPEYDFQEMKKKYAGTVIGCYLEKFPLEVPGLMTEVQRKALYYGVQALLGARED